MEATCSEKDCNRAVRSRGRCGSHYEKWRKENREEVRKSGRGLGRWDNPDGSRMTCLKRDCEKPVGTQGLCTQHYQNHYYESTRGAAKTRKNRKLTDYDGVKKEMTCTFEGCDMPEFNPGFCAGHYYQGLRHGRMTPLNEEAPCPVPGCEDTYWVKRTRKGVCTRHAALGKVYNLNKDRLVDLFLPGRCYNPGCGNSSDLHVDHDHACCPGPRSCGECVRGLLCGQCNTALGFLREDPERIAGLNYYLEGVTR